MNAARVRKHREKKRRALVVGDADIIDDDPADPGSDQLSPAGVEVPDHELPGAPKDPGGVGSLEYEQALWVRERRKISTLEYQRRRGLMVEIDEARQQQSALARKIRAALDRAPSYLPADLAPEARTACASAMSQAIKAALRHLADDE